MNNHNQSHLMPVAEEKANFLLRLLFAHVALALVIIIEDETKFIVLVLFSYVGLFAILYISLLSNFNNNKLQTLQQAYQLAHRGSRLNLRIAAPLFVLFIVGKILFIFIPFLIFALIGNAAAFIVLIALLYWCPLTTSSFVFGIYKQSDKGLIQ